MTNFQKYVMRLGSSCCNLCGAESETILHALRDCPYVMVLWLNVVLLQIKDNFFAGELLQWIKFNLSMQLDCVLATDWKEFWAVACHLLWLWRNMDVHNSDFVRPVQPWINVQQ